MDMNAAALKARGFFQQDRKDLYSLRLSSPGGTVPAAFTRKAAEIAETWGAGDLHFTTRQQIEIPHIPEAHLEAVREFLDGAGISTLTGGPRVRTVMACQGGGICKFGLIETSSLAREIHARAAGREFPAKVKIAVTGCKNNCAKVEANDIGIRGQPGASYLLYFGGSFGRSIRCGKELISPLAEREQVLAVVSAALDFYAARGQKGERFGRMLDRLGEDEFVRVLEDAAQRAKG